MRRNSSFHPPFSFLSSPRVHRSALPFSISCKRSRDLSYFLTPGGLDLGLLPRGSINQWEEDWRRLTSTNCVNGPDSNGLVSLPRRAESNSLPWKFSFSLSSLPPPPLFFIFCVDRFSFPAERQNRIDIRDDNRSIVNRCWIEIEGRGRDKEGIASLVNGNKRSVQELTGTMRRWLRGWSSELRLQSFRLFIA